MQSQHDTGLAPSARVEALKLKHKYLSHKIESEQGRPSISDYHLKQLKREKLKLKEEIEGIRNTS